LPKTLVEIFKQWKYGRDSDLTQADEQSLEKLRCQFNKCRFQWGNWDESKSTQDNEDYIKAYNLLLSAGVFNCNDAESWAMDETFAPVINTDNIFSFPLVGVRVPWDDMIIVADLFKRYGMAGICYWVSKNMCDAVGNFQDIRRHIDFVDKEEKIRKLNPNENDRAHYKEPKTTDDIE